MKDNQKEALGYILTPIIAGVFIIWMWWAVKITNGSPVTGIPLGLLPIYLGCIIIGIIKWRE